MMKITPTWLVLTLRRISLCGGFGLICSCGHAETVQVTLVLEPSSAG